MQSHYLIHSFMYYNTQTQVCLLRLPEEPPKAKITQGNLEVAGTYFAAMCVRWFFNLGLGRD
jgi:hypothetical protein